MLPFRARNPIDRSRIAGVGLATILAIGTLAAVPSSSEADATAATGPGSPFGAKSTQVGDFNGDGKADVLSKRSSDNMWMVSWSGTSPWTSVNQATFDPSRTWVADMNGDGQDDIFTLDADASHRWLVSYSAASPWTAINAGGAMNPSLARLGDLNNDGKADVFYLAGDNSWLVSYSGTSPMTVINQAPLNLDFTWLADMNGDGADDVFMMQPSGQWLVSYSGTTVWNFLAGAVIYRNRAWLADLDGDNKQDVFYVQTDNSWLWSRSATNGWDAINLGEPNLSQTWLADFDGDGKDDVFTIAADGRWLVSYSGTSLFTLINNGGLPSAPLVIGNLTSLPGGAGYTTTTTPTLSPVMSAAPGRNISMTIALVADGGEQVWSGTSGYSPGPSLTVPAGKLAVGSDYEVVVTVNDGAVTSNRTSFWIVVDPNQTAIEADKQAVLAAATPATPAAADLVNQPATGTLPVTPNTGSPADIAAVKAALPALVEGDQQIGAVPAPNMTRPQLQQWRDGFSGQPEETSESTVSDRVAEVWAADVTAEQTADWLDGVDLIAQDASYIPYTDSDFLVTSWKNITVNSDETASAVLMGHAKYLINGVWTSDSESQYEVELERDDSTIFGGWQLVGTVAADVDELAEIDQAAQIPAPAAQQTGSTARTYTYDRNAAVAYAKKYSCNDKPSCRNPVYPQYENDCTNFVSQAIRAGGFTPAILPFWRPYLLTWVNNRNFVNEVTREQISGTRASFRKPPARMTASYTSASKGDVIQYDFGKGKGWQHVAMVTGWGSYANYVNGAKKTPINYNLINGGRGDKVTQHSTDRDGSPWNYGYYADANPKTRAKWKVRIVHFADSGSYLD